MGSNLEVIDLCSDSEADSIDEYYKIVSSPEPSPKPTKTTKPVEANTTPALPAVATTKTIPLSSFRPAATVAVPASLAPIFRRNAPPKQPAFVDPKRWEAELEVIMPEPKKAPPKDTKKQAKKQSNSKSTPATQHGAPCGPVDAVALLDKLNAAQRRAVTSNADTVAILAGPGSGKTHTLTSRVAWLIDQVGFAPPNVIVATFTVKAAREMKERIGKVLGGGREKRIVLGTFHSVSLRYLSAYGSRIGLARGFSIVDDGDAKSILKRIIKRLNLVLEPPAARAWISKKKSKGCLGIEETDKERSQRQRRAGFAGTQNNEDAAHSKDYITKLEAVHDEYQKHLQSLNLLDYDDLLIRCTELLRAHPSCVANVQAVLIDEYQDTNGIQFELMKLFAQQCNRITVVGDPDQSIYGWRSAEITNLGRFLSDFPHTDKIALEENYRSSQCILSTSLQVIQQDLDRYDKSLLPVHKKGTLPVLRRMEDAPCEARWIVQEIHRSTLLSGNMINHGDIAILVRSASLSRPIEQALARAAVPYRMIGGRKFFERAEVKLLVDYLRVINQPSNNEVLSRIINVPRRGIGPKTIQGCLEEAETNDMSMWTLITKHCRGERTAQTAIKEPAERKMGRFVGLIQRMQRRLRGLAVEEEEEEDSQPAEEDGEDGPDEQKANDTREIKPKPQPKKSNGTIADAFDAEPTKPYDLVELITALTEQLNYRNYIGENYGGDEEARWANIDEFVTLAREFMNNAKNLIDEDELPAIDGIEQTKETDVLNKFLANISLSAEADKKQEGSDEPVPMVTISTIHAAKGLEWPVVFIPAAYEGSLPHSRADDFNEERRLLYVAMTRAKCLLNISYSLFGSPERNKDSNRSEQSLSPFLSELVDVWFAEKGPSFDRVLLDEMGDILGRPVPKHNDIYKNLPPNVPLEDNVFPLDPMEESRYTNDDEEGGYEYGGRQRRGRKGGGGGGDHQQEHLAKRRRIMDTPDYNTSGGSQGPWQRGYTTTMEGGGSNFTMGGNGMTYPGFTTASAHQTALLAAEATAAAQQAASAEASRSTDKRKRGALPSGQQTIMQSFTRSNSTNSTSVPFEKAERQQAPSSTAPMFQRPTLQQSVSLPSGIPAELRGRSLGGVRGNMMPIAGRGVPTLSKSTEANAKLRTGKQYAHFSSSPTRAELPPVEEPQQLHVEVPQKNLPKPNFGFNPPRPYKAPQRPVLGKENIGQHRVSGKTGIKAAGVVSAATVVTTSRPAASFHTTTYAQVQANGNVRGRPAMNMPGSIGGNLAPIDKLRQPFKPPSIQRPQ
ncbi:ATP-dependent DNA helicase srs2 [Sporothrix eucalyptigena]|uniref:DNA 3'-5' helicase n=1 Tax=Sporothrix eucalyptigena TaxID=1812306 RepID=A0ABP0CPC4_9PEZI